MATETPDSPTQTSNGQVLGEDVIIGEQHVTPKLSGAIGQQTVSPEHTSIINTDFPLILTKINNHQIAKEELLEEHCSRPTGNGLVYLRNAASKLSDSTTRDTALQTLAFHYQMTEVDLLKRNLVSFDEHGLVDVREVPAKRAESAAHNSYSPLLKLPAEIRNKIFRQVYEVRITVKRTRLYGGVRPHSKLTHEVDNFPDSFSPMRFRHLASSNSRVTQTYLVCRQLYQETILLLYSVPRYCFFAQPTLGDWLAARKAGHKLHITELETHWDWCRYHKVKEQLPKLSHVHEIVTIASEGIEFMLNHSIVVSYFGQIWRPTAHRTREVMRQRISCE